MSKLQLTEESLEKLLDKLSLMSEVDDEITISFKNGNQIKLKVLEVNKYKWS